MALRESTEAGGCLRLRAALALAGLLAGCAPPRPEVLVLHRPAEACLLPTPPSPGMPLPSELGGAPLRRVRGSLQLEVWAPASAPVPTVEWDRAWAHGCAALAFVRAELGLAAHEPWDPGPVRWVLLPDAAFAEVPGAEGADALALEAAAGEGDALVTPLGLFADLAELDDTLAHELVHVVQGRLAPGGEGVPWYVSEGMAVSAGARHGRARHGRATGPAEGYLSEASAEEVAEALDRFGVEDLTEEAEDPEEAHGLSESAGGLFVEHLRRAFPDAQARLLAAMAWARAEGFDAAFARAFDGLGVAEARSRLREGLQRTEGDWARRAAGTAFSPALSPRRDEAAAGQVPGGGR
jgi:hypothetical protein